MDGLQRTTFHFSLAAKSSYNNCIIRGCVAKQTEEEKEMYPRTQGRKHGRHQEWNAIVSNLFHSLHLQSSKFVNTK